MGDEQGAGGRAAVIGGGTMGAGIAQVLLEAGCAVVVVEADGDAASRARARIADGLARRKGAAAGEIEARIGRLGTVTGLDAPLDVELVVEAIPEIPAAKRDLLAAAEKVVPSGALLASNTSSLSITELAGALERPERFLGMHFFNPVPLSALVELVVGQGTAPAAVDDARRWVARLGKESIEVRDSPGFATSRLGVCLGLEAIRMLEEGVASAADIDQGMVLGYRHPMGPLRLTDLVGLDVRLAIAEHLAATLGPRFEPPALLREKVAAGELGQKSGRGFYDWS
ncbi:MAG TPA: 3-hydroxyacyl-CoA dehydrogenase family protein [Acidimicrobiia bacterium]|nr:3-hydroxyacyl-CoA dehydrogenase family protein [Acidimicrobiia bacterium]